MTRSPTVTAPAGEPTPFEIASARSRKRVPLRDIDIAPENLRFGDPEDDDIPLLAETLFAAGQLQSLTVRPGRRKEKPHMALDGRRRTLALRRLRDEGRIDDDFLVDVLVETDPARQVAAVLLTNTAVPVHVADIVAAIGRMIRSRLGIPAISRALGHAEQDIRRLAALSSLPEVALQALKAGRINLRQARLLARLPDPSEQAEFAQRALDGQGFPDWRIEERLDSGRVDAGDPRWLLVGAERYTAAGGRIEVDLFGEREPILLDPSVLTDAWLKRAREVAAVLESDGLAVHASAAEAPELPDDLERPPYVFSGMLPAGEMDAYREARARAQAAADAAAVVLSTTVDAERADPALLAMIRAQVEADQLALRGRVVTTLVLTPSERLGLRVEGFTPMEPPAVQDVEESAGDHEPAQEPVRSEPQPAIPAPDPEIAGVGHALHATRTDVATRGLIRALADDPPVALTALVAGLFEQVATNVRSPGCDGPLNLRAAPYEPAVDLVIPSLDGDVRRRLDARRPAWQASGQTVIAWIHGLDETERMSLLAELAALTLDLRETRTTLIRLRARSRAAELATLCGADITRHWTPDIGFLWAHPRSLLLGMLKAMGQDEGQAAGLKKIELVDRLVERAAADRWAPAGLSWSMPSAEPGLGDEGAPAAVEPRSPPGDVPEDDGTGVGAFEVTVAGEEALVSTG